MTVVSDLNAAYVSVGKSKGGKIWVKPKCVGGEIFEK